MPKSKKQTGSVRVSTLTLSPGKTRIEKIIEDTKTTVQPASTTKENQTYLNPPVAFGVCYWLHENSSALRPCIDVYKTNIDGFGHHFPEKYTEDEMKAAIKLDAEREHGDEAEYEGMKEWKTKIAKAADGTPEWDATVEARYKELRIDIDAECRELDLFFEYATPGKSFIDLRMDTREDREITGNAFWEVARSNIDGKPVKLYPATAKSIKLCPAGPPVKVTTKEQVNALDFRTVHVMRRLRLYRQETETGTAIVYFKEFGDPRVVSAITGNVFKTKEALQAKEGHGRGEAQEATELIHFRIHSGSTPYGIPRWLGAYKLLMGLCEKDQVDLDYFSDNTIPPGWWEVSGMNQRLGKDMIQVLERTMQDAKQRGASSQHEVPIIEATSEVGSTVVPRVEFHNLMDARMKDATHLKYAEACREFIRQMFRLPKFLLGDAADVNRSTSVSILEMAEMQVFGAERTATDFWMNHVFFPELDVRYHRFKSMGPQMEDLEAAADSLTKLVQAWIIKPEEARDHITDTTSFDLEDVDADWVRQPPELTLSGRVPEEKGDGASDLLKRFEREEEP